MCRVPVSDFALLSNQNNYKGPLSMKVLIKDVNCFFKILVKNQIHLYKKSNKNILSESYVLLLRLQGESSVLCLLEPKVISTSTTCFSHCCCGHHQVGYSFIREAI